MAGPPSRTDAQLQATNEHVQLMAKTCGAAFKRASRVMGGLSAHIEKHDERIKRVEQRTGLPPLE